MGTAFLTQGSNKRSITLDLKSEEGREILKKLVAGADVLVQNYRPGAFEALGLGYEALLEINPRLIYCSISAFGQDGVRREQTAYDHVIQATSGIMASTGTEEVNPIKIGAPAVDYATGTMGAFALAAALFQRERTGKGQHIDLAMLGVAMMMQASLMAGYFRNGSEPKPHGNKQPFATNSAYDAKEGMVMIGASNIRQQARFWQAVERQDMIKTDNEARGRRPRARSRGASPTSSRPRPPTSGRSISRRATCRRRGCARWPRRSPTRISRSRRVFHHFDAVPGIDGPVGVPLAAFKFAHGGPRIEKPPHEDGRGHRRGAGRARLRRGADRGASQGRGDFEYAERIIGDHDGGDSIEIAARGKSFHACLAVPEAGKGPGLVLFHDISDDDRERRELSEFYAAEGYVVLCPEAFAVADGAKDIAATVAALRGRNECTSKIGALGFGSRRQARRSRRSRGGCRLRHRLLRLRHRFRAQLCATHPLPVGSAFGRGRSRHSARSGGTDQGRLRRPSRDRRSMYTW